jgi:5-methylcytosine-specific restriction endonuclease McrA
MAKRHPSELFSEGVRNAVFMRAGGQCEHCKKKLRRGSYQFDHVVPISIGGPSTVANCEVLCRECHNDKTNKIDTPRAAKTKRQKAKHEGTFRPTRNPVPGSRRSRWRKPLRGRTELRSLHGNGYYG